MAEAVVGKAECSKCGAEVREGTVFCYACGNRVAADQEPEASVLTPAVDDAKAQAALDELAAKLGSDDKAEDVDEKLARAASERKKARVVQRKSRDFAWEPIGEVPQGLLIAVAAAFVLAVFAVVVTVVWK